MFNGSTGIFKELLKNGIYEAGDINTAQYKHYSYSVHFELKQLIIKINVADINKFSGAKEFDKALARNQVLNYLLEDFKLELLTFGLTEKEHYLIDKNNYTITIKENGYNKLLTKKQFPEFLKVVTLIFTLQHAKPHEIAAIIYDIMQKNNPCFRIMPSSTDNLGYELYADAGASEILAKQLRDAFRTAVLTILNHPDVATVKEVKTEVKADALPERDQVTNANKLSVSFNKYIVISKYMNDLIIRVSKEAKTKIPEPEIIEPVSRSRIKFADEGEGNDKTSEDKPNGTRKSIKIEAKKRRSLAASVHLNVTDENRDVWQHAVTTGLAAEMEDIVPINEGVTVDNKYEICQKLETFFLNQEKVKNIKMINLLFLGLLGLKDDINVHKHEKFDTVMFKKNTDSWQKLIKNIRNRAFELLNEEIDGKSDLEALRLLNKYRDEDIFRLHRANAFFMKVGRTSTIKKIDLLIEERQKNYVEKGKTVIQL